MNNTKSGNRNPVNGGKKHNKKQANRHQQARTVISYKRKTYAEVRQTILDFLSGTCGKCLWMETGIFCVMTGFGESDLLDCVEDGVVRGRSAGRNVMVNVLDVFAVADLRASLGMEVIP